MNESDRTQTAAWRPLDPRGATDLVDTRLQVHHAAQLAASFGLSFIRRRPDDSHTNFEWRPELGALASKATEGQAPLRLAVRPHPFALLALDGSFAPTATLPLNGQTIDGAVQWIRSQLAARGLDPAAYTLKRHYTIPSHRVAESAPFDTTKTARFEQLANWYADSALVLDRVVAATPGAGPVNCWPHHFDIATLLEVARPTMDSPQKTISLGMTPGDQYYADPYFYASVYPSPGAEADRAPLAGGGQWHTHEWLGAVLPGSTLGREAQREQVDSFIDSAVRACTTLLLAPASDGDTVDPSE